MTEDSPQPYVSVSNILTTRHLRHMNSKIQFSARLLQYAFGFSLLLIGLDKVSGMNLIVEWGKYVSPLALSVLPIGATTLILSLGVAEIVVGVLFFTRYRKFAARVAIVTLIAIIINLISLGMYDIALRDLLIALSAYVFLTLSDSIEGLR
jgi:hypothetical protein